MNSTFRRARSQRSSKVRLSISSVCESTGEIVERHIVRGALRVIDTERDAERGRNEKEVERCVDRCHAVEENLERLEVRLDDDVDPLIRWERARDLNFV